MGTEIVVEITPPDDRTNSARANASQPESNSQPSTTLSPRMTSSEAEPPRMVELFAPAGKRQKGAAWPSSWLAAIGLLAPVVPVPAIVVAIVIHYVVERHTSLDGALAPVLWAISGVAIVLGVWVLVALAWIPNTHCENANPNLYGRLKAWQHQFYGHLLTWRDWLFSPGHDSSVREAHAVEFNSKIEAFNEATETYQAFTEEFKEGGGRWAKQAGYLTLTRLRHRAEEARIGYAPTEEVVADAWDARLRLVDSKMNEKIRLDLQRSLETSLSMLGPDAMKFLPIDVQRMLQDMEAPSSGKDKGQVSSVSGRGSGEISELVARSSVRKAIYDINKYLDDRSGRLLDMRGHLIITAGWVGGLSYLLAVLGTVLAPTSSVSEPWSDLMLGAMALYLVGAACGLLYRVYVEYRSQFPVEDYGLSMMRIMTTPVLSGLMGVMGAVLLSIVLDNTAPPEVFNFVAHPHGLLYAAALGLTPNALINILQRQANAYIAEIESVKAPAAGAGSEESKV